MIRLTPGHPSNRALFDTLWAVAERNASRKRLELQKLDEAYQRDFASDEAAPEGPALDEN